MKYNALDCTSLDTEYSAGKKRKSESVKGVLSEKISKRRLSQALCYQDFYVYHHPISITDHTIQYNRARNKVLAKQTRYRKKFFFEVCRFQMNYFLLIYNN